MKFLHAARATAMFEMTRSLSAGRMSAGIVLGLFPPLMLILILVINGGFIELELIIATTTLLTMLLSALLWASPIVHMELEGKTWIYLASRPMARYTTYLGKYFVAAWWSFAVSFLAMSACMLIISMTSLISPQRQFEVWLGFTVLILLASITYSAVFSLIGVVFHRRAMVFAAGYALGSEVMLANAPALIGRITTRFHLTSLSVDLMGWPQIEDQRMQEFLSLNAQPAYVDVILLLLLAAISIGVCMLILRYREYMTADEA